MAHIKAVKCFFVCILRGGCEQHLSDEEIFAVATNGNEEVRFQVNPQKRHDNVLHCGVWKHPVRHNLG